MLSLSKIISATAIVVTALSMSSGAVADDYPERRVRLITPYAAGGLTDIVARVLAKKLSERIGQTVVVENRPGAGGIIGVETVAKSAADGYTLLLVGQGLASVNTSLHKDLPYDTLRDFVPLSLIARFSMVFVTTPDKSPASLSELIAMAKANPNVLNYGSAGNASTAHLMTELFCDQENIKMFHVAYKGESPAFSEIMAGRVTGMFATLGGAIPLIQAGKLHPIAIATKERSPLLPGVPTFDEGGVQGFEVYGWYGVLAPANTPKAITDRLTRELIAIGHETEFRDYLNARGMEAIGSTQKELDDLIQSETVRWSKIIQKVGIRSE